MTPVERDGRYILEVGNTSFEVDPALGGRITRFAAAGANVLMPLEDLGDWTNGGSTFWTSPQAAWGWPPPEPMDRLPYRAEVEGTHLVLTSPDTLVGAATLRIEKRFWVEAEREAIGLQYAVTNLGDALTLAGWEISRVPATGVTFYSGGPALALGGAKLPATQASLGVVWMDHGAQESEAKLGADADAGFIAYACPTLLFVKTFADVAPGAAAEGEAEVELYVKPREYVEIEQQSAARLLETGDTLSYALRWYIRPMDSQVEVAPGSESLLSFAKRVAGVP